MVKDIVLDINKTDTTVELSEGTVFTDENNIPIKEPPVVKVKVGKQETRYKNLDYRWFHLMGNKGYTNWTLVKVSIPGPKGANLGIPGNR